MDQACMAYETSGMRANLAWAVFGRGDEAEKQYEAAMGFTEDYMGRNSRISLSLAPHSPYLCPMILKKVVRKSEEFGYPCTYMCPKRRNRLPEC